MNSTQLRSEIKKLEDYLPMDYEVGPELGREIRLIKTKINEIIEALNK